jgi:hypothetical protein
VLTNRAKGQDMTAAAITEQAREAAKGLVHQEFITTYSLMAAYARVGQMVGRSGSWVRQFIAGGYYEHTPNLVTGMNLIELYRRTCERVERAAERLEHAADTRANSVSKGMGEE